MSSLSPSPKFRGVDTTTGLALVGGKLYTYASGTLTPKSTYTSSTLGAANANPTILDSRGEADVWLDGAYKFILKDSSDVTIWTVDAITDPTNGATFTNATFAGTAALVNLTVSGTTALGDAAADTLSVSGSVIKNATGNYSLPAPSAGATLAVAGGVAGTATFAAPSSGDTLNAPAFSTTGKGLTTGNTIELTGAANNTAIAAAYGTAIALVANQAGSIHRLFIGDGTGYSFRIAIRTGSVTTDRLTVSDAGNVTIAAPAAGVGFTGTGVAGADAFVYNGGTSGSFRVNTTGVPYGTSLHNNAGAVTGTTNQYICSGTWTCTPVGGINVTAVTAGSGQWLRVGNVVTASCFFQVDPTAADAATTVLFNLPIASAMTATTDCQGVGAQLLSATDANSASVGQVMAESTGDTGQLNFWCGTDASNLNWILHFTYIIK